MSLLLLHKCVLIAQHTKYGVQHLSTLNKVGYFIAHQMRCGSHAFMIECECIPKVCYEFGVLRTPHFLQCSLYVLKAQKVVVI